MNHKKMHKKMLAAGLAAVMTVGAAGSTTVSAADNETEKITFVLDWTPNTNHTGLYVAENLGYFEDQGLEVEIVQPPKAERTLWLLPGERSSAFPSRIPWPPEWRETMLCLLRRWRR